MTEVTIDKIYDLEKIWQKAYDTAKATEESISKDDKVKYWLKVHMTWRVQDAIRDKIKVMIDEYVSVNIAYAGR